MIREAARMPKTCPTPAAFPTTRYQGSKRRLAHLILAQLSKLHYHTVLDAFGGTGAVSHAFKSAGKAVTYNDILAFNHQIGLALIENDEVRLDDKIIDSVDARDPERLYPDFIERTFPGIYFTDAENRWLDVAVGNIRKVAHPYRRALCWHALFQSALAKRPYNLFHRRNLYMRTAEVSRGFGNKASWDRPFIEHFRTFAHQANRAVVQGAAACRATRGDALSVRGDFDLVYVDTPYMRRTGVGVNYRDFYHFLEGMVQYEDWGKMIDSDSRHRCLVPRPDPWSDRKTCEASFAGLFERFRAGALAVSYRGDGVPTIARLRSMLAGVKRRVRVVELKVHQYALSTNRASREMLLVGTD